MTLKFDLIDTFSSRPRLRSIASSTLRAALKTQYPERTINPDVAAITRTSSAGKAKAETLTAYLHESFAAGKTPRWKSGESTLIADPSAATPVVLDIDVEPLAILLDSVSIGLLERFIQSVVDFWDRPGAHGPSPGTYLALALQQQSQGQGEQRARDVLQAQLLAIQGVMTLGLGDFDEIERYLQQVTDVSGLLSNDQSAPRLAGTYRLEQLPQWLRQASSADRLDYSRKAAAVAVAGMRANGKSFNDDLPPILEYASHALQASLRADHPDAELTLDDVAVEIKKVVAAALPSAGQIVAVGSVENIRMSPAAFALENLSSLTNGILTLSSKTNTPLPDWLTADYLKLLVGRVDVGRVYPQLVRRYLITDTAEVSRRQALFADQLRVQLPLKALEQKIRGAGGLTQAGYQRVCAVLGAVADESTVASSIIRPLAFIAATGAPADEVANMFIIGAAELASGPFVLYRPFADIPLSEFASWSALKAAIVQPGDLQEEVLTWMSEHASLRYANGGFAQPHIVRFGQGSEFAPLETPLPAQLALASVQGDVFAALFSANARALADLADRESVSNAESRWALIKRGGWLALDTVMPFISGGVGSALWLAQLMSTVDQVLLTQSRGSAGFAAWNALLLNVSLILLHQGFSPRIPTSRRPAARPVVVHEPVGAADAITVSHSPSSAPHATPTDRAVLDFSWSSVSKRPTEGQAQALETLKVSPEPLLSAPSLEPGREGLYRYEDCWYARVDGAVYQVSMTDDEVFVLNPQDATQNGPRLKRINKAWALDLSLRLRGGAPKRNVRQLAQENAATLKRVTERKAVLEQRQLALYLKFAHWDTTFRTARGQLPPDVITLAEADLNEIIAITQEKKQLDQALRPADRTGDKVVGKDLAGVCRRISFFEALLLDNVLRLARSQLAHLQALSPAILTPGSVIPYMKLFDDLLIMQNFGVRWSEIRYELWQALRGVPKVGEAYWRQEVLDSQQNNLFSHLEWRSNRMWSLLETSFSKDNILSEQGALALKDLRIDDSLHAAFSSHAELEKPNDYTLAEQIGVLESSLREYRRATLVAVSSHESEPDAMEPEPFTRFLEDLSWIENSAEKRLSDLIRESEEPPEQPSEYAPKIKQPRKRVFKTRAQRTLIGRIREGDPDFPGEVVDVTQTMSDSIIGTYHRHENGEWVEVKEVHPFAFAAAEGVVALAELKRQASAGLARVEPDINNARRQAKRANEPEDMQDILTQKADKLGALADRLAARETEAGQDESSVAALQAQVIDLRAAAARLINEGRSIRIAMIKAQPPTAARVSYLYREREVNISRFEGRKNMSGARRNDFIQEYLIRDTDQRVLWWAHFHYASEDANAHAFTVAHLKMPEQRFTGYKALVKAAKDSKAVVSIYRSAIGKDLAQRLFLGGPPEAALEGAVVV